MIRVGITGGIGSGKTLVCQIFEKMGIPVFYADQEAKRIMNRDPEVKEALSRHFGSDMYDESGIKKAKLADIIFSSNEALTIINSIVHPVVRKAFDRWSEQQHTPYVIEEAAILFESGAHTMLDQTVLVYAPRELRIARAMKRDGTTREHIEQRMKNQHPDEDKLHRADFVIYNDDSRMVIPQVLELHERFRTL